MILKKPYSLTRGFFTLYITTNNWFIKLSGTAIIHILFLLLALRAGEHLDSIETSRLIRSGDKTAFQKFFEEYYDQLIRFLMARGTDLAVAQDLIQNAFLYIWENRSDIDQNKSLRSYLYRIAYTRMLNHFKSNKKFDYEADPNDQKFAQEDPEETLKGKELFQIVQSAVDKMPEKRKAVFELCFMQEFTYKETAELKKKFNTFKK